MQFLQYVADDLRKRFKHDLSRVAVVFPNKRASLFFNECLLKENETAPIWAPRYVTISELFDRLSTKQAADEIKSVCLLYDIYKEEVRAQSSQTEHDADITLDFFYGWGTQLLADFSNIDRSLVDAEELFGLWSAAKQLERMDDEERERLRPFVETFKAQGRLKEDFESLWQRLYPMYLRLNERLAQDGEAYEGARQREVSEGLYSGQLALPDEVDTFVFVGFSILLPVERRLLDFIKSQDKALFYWDYDHMYVGDKSPLAFGPSMANALKHFGSELPESLFDNLSRHEPLDFVAASSDNAQARYVSEWLETNLTRQEERRTAVVLCDEKLLQPVVHSLPDCVSEVNITKGFPMGHTPAYAYVVRQFNEPSAAQVGDAAFLERLQDNLQREAQARMQREDDESWTGQLTAESFFQCYTVIGRFRRFVDEGILNVGRTTLQSLVRQVLSRKSIPFHGEPASGLQVMGVLETRNLDFDSVLLLSVGEGIVPKRTADQSFIPYDLRKHYRIMTADEQTEVYAYNFFRLIQRARKVTMVYNESTDDNVHRGEMSRFMLQILLQTQIPVHYYSLGQRSSTDRLMQTEGVSPEAARRLMENRLLRLSPSSLGQYIGCPLRYFFANVARIPEIVKPTVVLPANNFGSIIHRVAERVYSDLRGDRPEVILESSRLLELAGDDAALDLYLQEAFRHVSDEEQARGGEGFRLEDHRVEAAVARTYVKHILKYDAYSASQVRLSFLQAEQSLTVPLDEHTQLKGIIDRLDRVTACGRERLRVVDYKTGGYKDEKMKADNIDQLFKDNNKDYVRQTLFYQLLCSLGGLEIPVAALYFTQKLGREFEPYVKFPDDGLTDTQRVADFRKRLADFVHHMRISPFNPTANNQNCRYCPYTLLCGRTGQRRG